MKQLRHVLALTLVFCMVFGMVTPSLAVSGEISVEEDYGIPVEEDSGIEIEVDDRSDYDIDEDREELSVLPKQDETADETNTTGKVDGYNYNIIHLDCGRKYFSVDSIKKIIDNASKAGFNYIQLAVGNDGMRFLLDDMSLTVNGKTYDSDAVKAKIHEGNEKYSNFDVDELTQSEMDAIIKYAYEKGMGVIPLINTPGHMDAILAAATSLTGVNCAYYSTTYKKTSVRTIDVTNSTAVAFTQAFLNKYITYFAGKGCKLFNMGADEYANDTGSPRFSELQSGSGTGYKKYVEYLNAVAADITSAGMTPMAFNDGIYYNNVDKTEIDNSIIIEYWSGGWDGYDVAQPTYLVNKEFNLVNTHGDWYWIVGGSQIDTTKASQFNYQNFSSKYDYYVNKPDGSTFCIWSDVPKALTDEEVATNTAPVISAFGATLPTVDSVTNGGGTTDPAGETVTVTVGGTFTVTQDGVNNEHDVDRNELDERIATVDVTGTDAVAGGDKYTPKSVAYGNLGASYNTWNKTSYYYPDGSGNYYPVYAKYEYVYYTGLVYYYGYSTTDSRYNVETISNGSSDTTVTVYEKTTTAATPASTTIAITGKTVGTTYITVGGVRYTINVVAENLASKSITVEYWITNVKVNTLASDATEKTIYASDSTVYSENGALLSGLVPEKGKRNTQSDENLVFWKGTRLVSGSEQTTNSGDDKTRSGDDFKYIRYWDSKWSFSADGVKWKDFNTTDQIVAYYLQRTEVTDEINTEVVDWGEERSGYGYSNFVLMDYAVMYQSGERLPGTFPVANKTIAFHCDPNDTNTVKKYSETSTQWYNYYRQIGMIRGQETSDYEVYMITLTPTSTNKNTQVASYASSATSYTYDYSNEKVIWVDDIANLGDFADQSKWYTSVSGDAKYGFSEETSVGGMPIVPGVEITNRHGLLVTYYIRAKATPDSLTVHYMDRTNGDKEFYSYPINVNQGTTFKTGPYLPEIPEAYGIPTHINNGDVVNSLGKTQYVSSVLATMPEINVAYRYSSYECVEVVRREDGKDLYLYYTFKNTHSFVVDFGVPLHLTTSDIAISGNWTSYTATQGKYGTVEYDGTQIGGGITYTPTEVMQGRDEIAVTLNGENGKATHFIYLYPATNVLYEENVITNPEGSGWTTTGDGYTPKDGNGDIITTQTTEKLGEEEIHGYDDYYDPSKGGNTGFSNGYAYVAELTLPAGERNVRTKDVLSFTFTGTGFDLISECGTNTGALLVNVYRVGSDGSKTLDHGFLVDTYFSGDTKGYITGTDILDYQVPVVRDFIKKTATVKTTDENGNETEEEVVVNDHDTYEVTVKGFLFSHSGAAVNSTNAISTYSSQNVVEETLASLGIPEEDFGLYEVVYMDDNSVLNGGTGAETSVVKSDVTTFVADIASNNALELNDATDGAKTAKVYVDGIRVYNTIDPSKQPDYKTSEKNTEYYNVYDFVLNSSAGTSDQWYEMDSAIYIEKDGETSLYDIADYKKQGPENEIYLTSDNAVVFALDGYNPATSTIQVAVKAVSGTPSFNGNSITHATELYYEVSYDGGNGYIKHSDNYGYYIILTNDDGNGKSEEKSVLSISAIKVSSNIKLIANAKLGDEIVKDLNSSTTGFKPKTFTASIPKTVKINRRFTVTITASDDVAKVIVKDKSSGNVIGAKEQMQAKKSGDTYRYSIIATAPHSTGNYTILVYAENSSGTDSDPIELTITVK